MAIIECFESVQIFMYFFLYRMEHIHRAGDCICSRKSLCVCVFLVLFVDFLLCRPQWNKVTECEKSINMGKSCFNLTIAMVTATASTHLFSMFGSIIVYLNLWLNHAAISTSLCLFLSFISMTAVSFFYSLDFPLFSWLFNCFSM